jgi:multidrug efflux pump subunit AcrB
MDKLIQLALGRPRTVTIAMLTLVVLGTLALEQIPVDILPVYNRPGVQVLTFYSGMPAENVGTAITNPMERWTGTATGMLRQESRSILGASIIRNFFRDGVDRNGALTEVQSLALAEIPNLPPGTLPPIVLPFDPTGTVPACLIAVDSETQGQSILYDVARYEVRNMIMSSPGANAPVVYGGKIRAVLAYVDPIKLRARGLSLMDVMKAIENYNLFLPTGDAKLGTIDYAIDSNSMMSAVEHMAGIPLRVGPGYADFLGDVADPKDASLIQTNIVRVNGRREVYIPVYRQPGTSTLHVVDHLRSRLPEMAPRLSRPAIGLKLVMDQSVYVRQSIRSLATEAILGAFLCSLVILVFLGEWRMTLIAVLTIPISVLTAIVLLHSTGNTINVMTLGGLALAIGPLVDSAIICLENTHRHLRRGDDPEQAAFLGASEVAMPELVASCCTLLVLSPLALMSGMGPFLFKPMALAVAFAMITAYLLSRSFVPSRCATWLRPHALKSPGDMDAACHVVRKGMIGRAFDSWESLMSRCGSWYARQLNRALRFRWQTATGAAVLLVVVVVGLGPQLRREFFPEVDAGAFEIYARAASGTRIELTEEKIARVENTIRDVIGNDLQLVISELGVQPDWSAAFTPNAGPMDAAVKVQLNPERRQSAQEYAQKLRKVFAGESQFTELEFAFNTGGTIRSALNEGTVTPINIRIESRDLRKAHEIARHMRGKVAEIPGVVDARILQRLDYPEYFIEVDRAKARELGLTQEEIMKNVVAAVKSSIQFNKKNFWIDAVSQNQYYVGVQYPESDIQSLEDILNVPVTSPVQAQPIPLSNLVRVQFKTIAAEVTHSNLQSTIDVTMNVDGRDLGHVAEDVAKVVAEFGRSTGPGEWAPYDPSREGALLRGSKITLSGEYRHMQETFANFGVGLALAILFVYFLMVVLLDSYLIPLVILGAVPVSLIGVICMLFVTGTALNVQSLLGIIFTVGIVVSNTVLLTDFAEKIRSEQGLSPTEAIRRAAAIRARPVMMTALAALCALIPMALALERGSEANAPLGRAVIGGLLAGVVTTLAVVPAIYSLVVRDSRNARPST